MNDTIPAVTLTEKAAAKARQMLDKRGTPEACIRVGVATGGCSGFSYKLEYADTLDEGDQVFESFGIKIAVDAKSLLYLAGTQVDYVNDPFKGGFKFGNPNQKAACGCGESFTV